MATRTDPRRASTRTALRGVAATVTAVLGATFATGCATEVIDSKVTTTIAVTDTSALPSLAGSSLDELAEVLDTEVTSLSRAVFDDDKPAARDHLDRINEAWALAEPLIVAQFGELADQINYDLRRVVALARSAVERNRPADASKAASFLRLALVSLGGQ
jgi:hypothetical protein